MEILARIKTGFFEMKPYRLKAEDGKLLLIPIREDGEEVVVLAEGGILSVTLPETAKLPSIGMR